MVRNQVTPVCECSQSVEYIIGQKRFSSYSLKQCRQTETKPAETEEYLRIPMFSEGLPISKRLFQDGVMCGKTDLLRAHCQQVPKTHYSPVKHRRSHWKQDHRSSLFCSAV